MELEIVKARIAYALAQSVGRKVFVQTKSGDEWSGLLYAFTPNKIVLKDVCQHGAEFLPQISLPFANVVRVSIESAKSIDKFKTDS
jgi:small nuclear ribonucleoprotein (snRNP)-like protein